MGTRGTGWSRRLEREERSLSVFGTGPVARSIPQKPMRTRVRSRCLKTEWRELMNNETIVYEGENAPSINVLTDGETVWLTQAQMCQLFGRERSVITKATLKNNYYT